MGGNGVEKDIPAHL